MHTVMNAELADMRAKLYYSILSKGIEHLWILLSVGVLKPIPLGYGGMTVLHTFYIRLLSIRVFWHLWGQVLKAAVINTDMGTNLEWNQCVR